MQIKFGDYHGDFTHTETIQRALNKNYHEGLWRDLWLDAIAWDLGYTYTGERGCGCQMVRFLSKHGLKVVYHIYVDDIFGPCGNNDVSKQWLIAVRSLLQDVTGYIESYDSVIDLTICVSEQLAKDAITQNYGQFKAHWSK